VQSARLLSRVERDLDGGDTLTLTPYVLWGDMEFLQHFIPGDPLEENEYTAFGLQSAYVTDISAETTLTFGVDLEYAQGSLLHLSRSASITTMTSTCSRPPRSCTATGRSRRESGWLEEFASNTSSTTTQTT
jgi:hypothetical protein